MVDLANRVVSATHGYLQILAQPKWRPWVKRFFVALVLTLVFVMVARVFGQFSLDEILSSLTSIPAHRILLALAFAAGSYFTLTWFDWLGLHYAGKPLAYPKAALASFTSLSLGHNIGFAALSSGAIRFHFYSKWGLDVEDVAKVILFCGVTVGLGLMTTGGIALLLEPDLASKVLKLGSSSVLALGSVCLALPAAYVLAAATMTGDIRLWKWKFSVPSARLAAAQVGVGSVNYLFVSASLYNCMAGVADVPYGVATAAYIIANSLALLAHVPGGLGVLEGVMVLLISQAAVLGALIAFRVVYYLVPLLLGGTVFLLLQSVKVPFLKTS